MVAGTYWSVHVAIQLLLKDMYLITEELAFSSLLILCSSPGDAACVSQSRRYALNGIATE